MPRRIIILGGPRTGKSTLSERFQSELGIDSLHTSAELEHLFPVDRPESWSQQSEHAAKWFDESGDWICEGVQMARGLRKWLKANPGTPLDADIFLLRQPMVAQRDGQKSMMKGVETVFKEIEGQLIKRGARIHKLKDPNDAIAIFESGEPIQSEEQHVALKKTLTKAEWDALPETTRKFYETEKVYVADGENWKLDAEGEDVTGLKSALQKEREAREKHEKQARDLAEKYKDIDPAKYAEMVAAQESKETEELKKKGQFDEFVAKHNKKLEDQKADYEKKLAAKDAELDKLIVDAGLRKVLEAAGVLPDRMEDAVDLVRPRAKRNEKGELIILDDDRVTPLAASPEVFAKELLKEKKPWLYKPNGNGGSGAENGLNGKPGDKPSKTRAEANALPPAEKMTFMEQVSAGKAVLTD